MNFTIEEFISLQLTPNEYILLYSFVIEDTITTEYLFELWGDFGKKVNLLSLEKHGYIKITTEDFSWIPRQKLLSLRDKINPEPDFEEFWNKYHEITGLKKTDLQATIKYWKKLTKNERQKAVENISNYYDSLPIYSTGRPVKKARTYLGDKNFNDEFEVIETRNSLNEMK